jgi:hypothetical protein
MRRVPFRWHGIDVYSYPLTRAAELASCCRCDGRMCGPTRSCCGPRTRRRSARAVPIMSRMREVLDSRRKGPDGQDHAPDRFVFGNEPASRSSGCATPGTTPAGARRSRISTSTTCAGSSGLGSSNRERESTTSLIGSATPTWRRRASTLRPPWSGCSAWRGRSTSPAELPGDYPETRPRPRLRMKRRKLLKDYWYRYGVMRKGATPRMSNLLVLPRSSLLT